MKTFEGINSLEEFKSRLLSRGGVQNIQFVSGLDEFLTHVIQDNKLRSEVAWEDAYESRDFAGMPAPGSVKTLVYTLPDSSLLLCLLDMDKYLDTQIVAQKYSEGNSLKKATREDLHDLGMVAGACHGFPPFDSGREWVVLVDDGLIRYPIYEAETYQRKGAILAGSDLYAKIMQARFPGRIVRDQISRSK